MSKEEDEEHASSDEDDEDEDYSENQGVSSSAKRRHTAREPSEDDGAAVPRTKRSRTGGPVPGQELQPSPVLSSATCTGLAYGDCSWLSDRFFE